MSQDIFRKLYFEEVNEGDSWETPGRTVTEAMIDLFAGLSGDFNPLHTDEAFAKQTPFGKRIAHGILGIAVATGLVQNYPPMRTLAFLGIKEWNFRAPIFPGDTVRVRSTVLNKRLSSKSDKGIITWKRELINERGEVVQEGITVTMVEVKEKK